MSDQSETSSLIETGSHVPVVSQLGSDMEQSDELQIYRNGTSFSRRGIIAGKALVLFAVVSAAVAVVQHGGKWMSSTARVTGGRGIVSLQGVANPCEPTAAPNPCGTVPTPAPPPVGHCPAGKSKCNLMIVVDMQNDYCKQCGSKTVSKWAGEDMLAKAAEINDALALKTIDGESAWDLVVFTQDWLQPGEACNDCAKWSKDHKKCLKCVNSALVHDTFGAQVISQIHKPANKDRYMMFTKNTDDWFTALDEKTAWDGKRHFALNGESIPGNPHPTLREILVYRGFTPEKTRMVVTGVASNRCVMKGSTHARYDNYRSVYAFSSAIAGMADKPENWRPGDNAPHTYCGTPENPCDTVAERRPWEKKVFLGYKGGPTRPEAVAIMLGAGITVVPQIKDVAEALDLPIP